MGDDLHVSIRGVSKKFARSLKRSFVYGAEDIVRAAAGRPLHQALRDSEFWALRDISFDLRAGESTGIVGLNGSGKTTLLRLISGILRPTSGHITVNGRLAPMLALGAGFKPVLSGRENVFLNMSLLGVPHGEIRRRFDEVVDFADVWEAIDAPLGTYSSGMQMRLGFACAVHTQPQILVIDEVLAVGDVRFRVKCRNKINDLRRDGVSMLIVSHSAISVETLTNHCIYLEKGAVKAQGAPSEVLRLYEADTIVQAGAGNRRKLEQRIQADLHHEATNSDDAIRIRNVRMVQDDGAQTDFWSFGQPGALAVDLTARHAVEDVSLNLIVTNVTDGPGENVQFLRSRLDIGGLRIAPPGAEVTLLLPHVGLRPGDYRLKLSVSSGPMDDLHDVVDGFQAIVRPSEASTDCDFYQPRRWVIGATDQSVPDPPAQAEIEEAEEF